MATFTQWVDAYAQHQTRLADFYFKRFRPEFKPAVDAWIATKPQQNPNAPLTPFAMPQYQLAARAEANRLEAKADASSAKAITDVQPGAQLPRQAPAGVDQGAGRPAPLHDPVRERLLDAFDQRHQAGDLPAGRAVDRGHVRQRQQLLARRVTARRGTTA